MGREWLLAVTRVLLPTSAAEGCLAGRFSGADAFAHPCHGVIAAIDALIELAIVALMTSAVTVMPTGC
jgi:hypothetical protein